MKLRFTPRALDNLDVISSYLRSKNPAATSHVRAAIYASLQTLILFPGSDGPKRPRAFESSSPANMPISFIT